MRRMANTETGRLCSGRLRAEAKHVSALQVAALLGAGCLTAMAATAITPSLPGIAIAFGGAKNATFLAQLALTMPALVIALTGAGMGFAVDRLGARRVLLWSAVVFAAAGSVGAYAATLHQILASRAVLGLAIAGMNTSSLALIGALFEGNQRHQMIGLQGAAASFGGMLFLLLGGLLAGVDWRLPFLTYLMALALIPLFLLALPRRGGRRLLATTTGADQVRWPQLSLAVAAAFLGMILFYVIPVHLPFHLAAQGWSSPELTGYALGLCTLTGGVVAFFYGRLQARLEKPVLLTLAFALMGMGQLMSLVESYPAVLVGMMAAGASVGLLLPTVNGLALGATPPRMHGRSVGLVASALFLGQFLAPISSSIAASLAGTSFLGTGSLALAAILPVLRALTRVGH
ncbi:putative MFS family arabinose efflux permease [Ruegeria sp. P4]|nr:putative MFS family arabinose efflux permease [Ruegeria sp. P4]